jgi:TP901 family phage tail tape measure protein
MANSEKKVSVVFTVKNDEFNRNLNETKQQINLTAKELQTASAKMNLYGSNLQTLGEKHTLLKTQISQVTDKLNKYKSNLDTTTTKLNSNKQALEQLVNKKKELTAEYNQAIKTYGKESEEVQKLKEKISQCKSEYNEMNDKIKNNVSSLNSSQRQIVQTEAELAKYQLQMKETNKAISEQSSGFIQAGKKFTDASEKLKSVGGTVSDVGGSLMGLSAPFAVVGALGVKSAVDFESAFAGVKKTVDGTPEQLEEIRQGILKLSEEMPESAEQISTVGEAAGQLGIKTENVLDFTKTMVMMGDSTNLSSEEAAIALAKLANITQMPQENFQRLGSSVVELGNNMATTESDITEMSLRLAGAGHQVGMSEAQIVGLGAGLSSVGVEAEAGGSAFSKLMVQMQLASETGSKANDVIAKTGYGLRDLQMLQDKSAKKFKALAEGMGMTSEELKKMVDSSASLEAFSKVTGKTANEFSQSFKKDATGALLEFIKGLQNCEKNGTSAISVLDSMGITEVRMRDALLRASGAGDKFTQSINLSTNAWDKNVALTNEAEKRYETTKSKIEICKNKLKEFGIEIGDKLLPYVTDMIGGLENLVKWFGSLDSGTQQLILKTGMITFATGGLLKVTGGVVKASSDILGAGGKLLSFIGKFATATETATVATEAMAGATTASAGAFGVFSGVLLPIVGVIGVVAGGIYALHEANDVMKTGISTTTDKMSLMERAMASLMGIQRYSKAELQDMGIEYKDFSENTSKETQDALTDTANKFRELQFEIDRVNVSDAITDEEKNSLITKFNDLFKTVNDQLGTVQSESYNTLKDTFMLDGIIDESEQKILDSMDKAGTDIKNKITTLQQEENELEKNGALNTVEGRKQLNDKIVQLQDIYGEQMIAKEKTNSQDLEVFKQQANTLSLENAKEIASQQAQTRNDEVEKIRGHYDKSIGILKASLKDCTEEERKDNEAKITSLTEQETKELGIANSKYDGYIKVIQEKYPEIMKNINKFTGAELDAKELESQKELEKLKSHYENLDSITQSGTYLMENTITGSLQKVSVTVDQNTGEITGMYDGLSGNMGAYSKDIENSLKDVAGQTTVTGDIMNAAMNNMAGNTVNSAGQIKNANGDVVGSLQNVTTATDGTVQGILNINGTPVAISTNADGTIRDVNGVTQAVNDVPGYKQVTIGTRIEGALAGFFKNGGIMGAIGGFFGQAEGTSNAPAGVYNVNERGQELFDSISGSQSFSLTSSLMASNYDSAYLSSGTKVTNALMTTAKMNRAIETGIQSNTVKAIDALASGIATEIGNAFSNMKTKDSNGTIVNELHLYLGNKELTNMLADGVVKKIDRKQTNRKV